MLLSRFRLLDDSVKIHMIYVREIESESGQKFYKLLNVLSSE